MSNQSSPIDFNHREKELHGLRALVVDDHPASVEGLELMMNELGYFRVIRKAYDGNEAMQMLKRYKFDMVFLDISLPNKDGIELLKYVKNDNPNVRVVMFTMHDSGRYVTDAYNLRANGFLLKDADQKELDTCIKAVAGKGSHYSTKTRQMLMQYLLQKDQRKNNINHEVGMANLTDRELDVLKLCCQELKSKDIAKRLFLSESTVKWHKEKIRTKIGCDNLAGMIKYALKHDIIDL